VGFRPENGEDDPLQERVSATLREQLGIAKEETCSSPNGLGHYRSRLSAMTY